MQLCVTVNLCFRSVQRGYSALRAPDASGGAGVYIFTDTNRVDLQYVRASVDGVSKRTGSREEGQLQGEAREKQGEEGDGRKRRKATTALTCMRPACSYYPKDGLARSTLFIVANSVVVAVNAVGVPLMWCVLFARAPAVRWCSLAHSVSARGYYCVEAGFCCCV